MNRKPLLVIAALAAIAAIVALTTGISAGSGGRLDQPGDGSAALISCLASHGVQVPSGDPTAVKPWLADHQSEPAVHAAIEACRGPITTGADKQSGGGAFGPPPAALIACLEQHGVDVPSDAKQTPAALKPWLARAVGQPSAKAALDDCTGG